MNKFIRNIGLLGCGLLMVQCTSDEFADEFATDLQVVDETELVVSQSPFLSQSPIQAESESRTTTTPEGMVSWDGKDRLKVFVVDQAAENPTVSEWEKLGFCYVTDDEKCKQNVFFPNPYGKQPQFYHKHAYDWYVMSPFSEDVKHPLGVAEGQQGFNLAAQVQDFAHPMEHLTKVDVMTNVAKNVPAGEKPSMGLEHKGTLMKFTIRNTENQPITLLRASFEVPTGVCISGRFAIDFTAGGAMVPIEEQHSLALSIKDAQPLQPGESYDVYAVMAPFALKSGQSFKIRVYSDLGTFVQSATMKEDIEFLAGKMNTAVVSVKGSAFEDGRVVIPDKKFESFLMAHYNTDGDGMISEDEAASITELQIGNLQIESLEGIEYMPNLKLLSCESNRLKSLDLSNHKQLAWLNCSRNQLEVLDVSKCSGLSWLNCSHNQLKQLNLQGSLKLTEADCSSNQLDVLNLSNCKELKGLNCSTNNLTELDLSNCTVLTSLNCASNHLTKLNLSNCIALNLLNCSKNQLETLDVRSSGSALVTVDCSTNALKGEFDISKNYNLQRLDTRNNHNLSSILVWDGFNESDYDYGYPHHGGNSFYKDPETSYVWVKDETLVCAFADANFKKYLTEHFDRNKDGEISEFEAQAVVSINLNTENVASVEGLHHFANLERLKASGSASNYMGQLKTLDVSRNPKLKYLECEFNYIEQLDLSHNPLLEYLDCDWNQLSTLDVSIIPLLNNLSCRYNKLQTLQLGKHPSLRSIDCGDNPLSSLDVKDAQALKELTFRHTSLIELDLSGAKALERINCEDNVSLAVINLENVKTLNYVNCPSNVLRTLNLRNCTSLVSVDCVWNKLEHLDLTQCINLRQLDCNDNQLQTLEIGDATELSRFSCYKNQLSTLDISKNTKLSYMHTSPNPNLKIIYVWKGFLPSSFSCIVDKHTQFLEKE